MSPRQAQPLRCIPAIAARPASLAGSGATHGGRGSTIARLALAVVASATWLLIPSAVPGQERDTTTARTRPRPGAAASVAAPACCRVVRLDGASPIVTARETATGYTFRFELENRRRRAALKIGDPVWADFGTNTVKLDSTDRKPCCVIVKTPSSSGSDRQVPPVPPTTPTRHPPT